MVKEPKELKSLMYWKRLKRPLKQYNATMPEKYLVFIPWAGGLSNQRMSFETAAALAYLTNRTLVLPDKAKYPHLKGNQTYCEDDFYDLEDIGIKTMACHDFCKKNNILLPKLNHKSWGFKYSYSDILRNSDLYMMGRASVDKQGRWWSNRLQDSGHIPTGISQVDKNSAKNLGFTQLVVDSIDSYPLMELPHKENKKELAKPLRILFNNDSKIAVICMCLGNFYFKLHSRYMIDACQYVARHIHYKKDTVLVAAKVVDYIRQHHSPKFYSIHLRLADEFKEQIHVPKTERILKHIEKHIPRGETVYIATDTNNLAQKDEWSALFNNWNVISFADVEHVVDKEDIDIQKNSHGRAITEQLICARGELFIGSYLSTFSAYINRLRGYMPDVRDKRFITTFNGYQPWEDNDSVDESFANENLWKNRAFWCRDFAIAFRDLQYK